MANQLADYDGEELLEDALQQEEGANSKKAAEGKDVEREEILTLKLQGRSIVLEHKNLDR